MKAAIRYFSVVFAVFLASAQLVQADGQVRFGPYEALVINSEVIRGVKVDEAGKIWLLLNPTYREQEITVKISTEEGAGYRKWFNGTYELVSPANQGKQANQWTDWIETVSPYIEYWMSGEKILHLKRVK
jgi:hypothetical protein